MAFKIHCCHKILHGLILQSVLSLLSLLHDRVLENVVVGYYEEIKTTTKKIKPPFTMITVKYFTTNININYILKKLECDYI